jgi:Icc-related predicted phosphoesterase
MVKLLATADVHGSQRGKETLKKFIEGHEPDVAVVAGDITHFGPPEWAEEFLDSFDIPLLAVNGNCDPPRVADVIRNFEDNDLMDKERELAGLTFVGLGYPLNPELGSLISSNIDVLVSHVPPKGCNDVIPVGGQIGDFFLREAILNAKPRLVLSGHVHECRGICELEGTVCVNPGPAMNGFGAVVDISDKIEAGLIGR